MSEQTQRPDNTDNVHGDAPFDDAERVEEVTPHEPIVDADDAQATEAHDRLQKATDELNQLGDNLAKVAADAAYATIGLVGVVSDRVKGYYEEQKKQYSTDHPDLTEEPTAKHLLSQLNDQLDSFVGDLGKVFRDLVDRGRASGKAAADGAADTVDDLADTASDLADDVVQAAEAVRTAADDVEGNLDAEDRKDW